MNYFEIIFAIIKVCKNWPTLLFNRITAKLGWKFVTRPVSFIELRNGIKFSTGSRRSLGSSDLYIISEIWDKKNYFLKGNEKFVIAPDDTVVDIGANKGYFSVFAAKKAHSGKVFAFEPAPDNFQLLQENLQVNNIKNVIAQKAAISASAGVVQLYLSDANEGGHSLYGQGGNKVDVESIRLVDFCRTQNITKIDFLKIDCEGAEYEIVKTMPDDLIGRIDKISMEYHMTDSNKPEELTDFLISKNFEILEFKFPYIKAKNRNLT